MWVAGLNTSIVNTALTIIRGFRRRGASGMGPDMHRTTQAGGCFLAIFILAGFVYGLIIQNPMKGVLIGTGVGIALAVLVWLIDRMR